MLPRNQKQPPPGCAPVRDLMDERMRRVAEEIFSSAHKRARTNPRYPAKNAVFFVARNRMTALQVLAWLAREPELMYGAKGRASSQRSTDYHSRHFHSSKKSGEIGPLADCFEPQTQAGHLSLSVPGSTD
jgi:hypothetical protein